MKTSKCLAWILAAALTSSLSASGPSGIADAAMARDTAAVKKLLKEGGDVNAAQGDGMTALHWAALNGDAELASMLLYAGANVSARTRLGGYTLVNLDVSYTSGDVTFGGHVKNLFDTRWAASMWNDGAVTLTNPGDGLTLLASVETAL